MKALAVITARGGSKRIPDKNIRPFCGRPILTYSIEAAQNSGLFEEVMVSTDSKRIAGIAEAAHASVPFLRSEKTAMTMPPRRRCCWKCWRNMSSADADSMRSVVCILRHHLLRRTNCGLLFALWKRIA